MRKEFNFSYRFGEYRDILEDRGILTTRIKAKMLLVDRDYRDSNFVIGVVQLKEYPLFSEGEEQKIQDEVLSMADHINYSVNTGKTEVISPNLVSLICGNHTESKAKLQRVLTKVCVSDRIVCTPLRYMPEHERKNLVLGEEYENRVNEAIEEYKKENSKSSISLIQRAIIPLVYCKSKYGLNWNESRLLECFQNMVRLNKATINK